ncbi:hypothetical protein SLS62_008333 [Diatrype stigma]|uniref:Uncharacterized protein n=1 Tax=Diatrype stigma TaxID=117547 RepID=A0AAN9YP39_9PEZI
MYVAEYASRPIFWVIAILMFASWFIMIDPVDKPPQKNQAEAEAEAESPEPPPPNSSNKEALTIKPQLTRRLLPYITSRPRKVFILLACLTMLSLGLLEGYWDVVTAWRFGNTSSDWQALFKALPPTWKWEALLIRMGRHPAGNL